MSNVLDLTQLTTQQLTNLLWDVKGTPQATAVYEELRSRPPRLSLNLDDLAWEQKFQTFFSSIQTGEKTS
ncbi:hypothetical protein [Synechococcus sp. PCC 6312]|uniref:hypothetical protein n=1 Tax=Synechococcus sp. (strain ATCC 27167 / PCC 6312) TaxID=195253 RepID=UPI00029ED848|nr:hypothetical protein [Synechococcus sp. PCC 6312]AFY61166.1 hypothetical protein Syn6312_2034 [Synechococcus sp. PCC 6312]